MLVTVKWRGAIEPDTVTAASTITATTAHSADVRATRLPRSASTQVAAAVVATTVAGRCESTWPPTSANVCAAHSTIRAGHEATHSTTAATSTLTTATAEATNDTAAANIAAGTAIMLAGNEARRNSPKVASNAGSTAIWAPSVTAASMPTRRGQAVRRR